MSPRRPALAVVLVVVAATVVVGAAPTTAMGAGAVETPSPTPASNATETPLGERLTMAMQSNAARAQGAVENGMWAAAFANASNASAKRALVERRVGQLNGTIAELQADRRALQAAFRNGTINRTAYRARLSAIVGRLSALGEAIEETSERGASVGVNRSRLDELRTRARNLSGPAVSRLARNLTGDPPGLFDGGPPGQAGAGGPGEAANRTNRSGGNGQGPPTDRGPPGNESDGNENGEGPPTDRGPPDNGSDGNERGEGPPDDSDRGNSGNESESDDDRGPPDDSDRGDAGDESESDDDQGPPTDSDRGNSGNGSEDDGEGQGPPDDSDRGNSGNGSEDDGEGQGPPDDSGGQPTATETESDE